MPFSRALGCLVLALAASQSAQPSTDALRIRLPAAIAADVVNLSYSREAASASESAGLRVGETLAKEATRTSAGDYADYTLRGGRTGRVTLLLYVPGYQMITADFAGQASTASTPFTPPLVPLPAVTLDGRLVDSSNAPVANQPLTLSYQLLEAMSFFGYMDGVVPTLRLGSTRTDASGNFTFAVPAFDEDPFFRQHSPGGATRFQLSTSEPSGLTDDTLRPSSFAAHDAYATPFVVTKMVRGGVSGRLGPAFLEAQGLPLDLQPYVRSADSRPFSVSLDVETRTATGSRSYNAMLTATGTFGVELPPGKYDLNLSILGPGFVLQRRIVVVKDLVIEEGRRSSVDRP